MKYIDDHDAAKKKSNKDAGITDGDDEEMFDAEPVENKSELTLLQVGFLCFTVLALYLLGFSSHPLFFWMSVSF
jgi:hypothetical protein